MKQITTKNEATTLFLDAVYQLSLDSTLELEKYIHFVVNQRKLGAGTLGELALKNRQEENGDNSLPMCPRCNSSHTVKNGLSCSGNQRYKCTECGKSFTDAYNSLSNKVTQNAGQWMLFVQCLLKGETLKDTAIMCDISEKTALDWRLRVFEALELLSKDVQLSGVINADDTRVPYNLKGNHGSHFAMPRNARKRGGQNTIKNYHKNQICVLCAVDNQGRAFSRCVGFGKPSGKRLVNGFTGKLCVNKDAIFVSDGDKAYGKVVEEYNIPRWEIRISEKKGTRKYPAVIDDIHLQRINAYHSRLKEYLLPAHGTASRYLPGKLLLFDYLENNKHRSIEALAVEILSAMTKNVGKTSVTELKHKYSIPVSNGPEKYTWELKIPVKEQAIYRDWVNKMPAKEVAAKHHIRPRKIYQIRDKVERYQVHDEIMNPVKKPTRSGPKQPKILSDRDWDIFKRHCHDRETLKAIGEDYGVTLSAIHKVVKKVRRTAVGTALEKEWKKARTPSKKKRLPKEDIIRDVHLIRSPKTPIRTASAIVAETYGCTLRTAEDTYYLHRCKTGDIYETRRWKKERLELKGEEYQKFYNTRNQQIYQTILNATKANPRLRKIDVYTQLATTHNLTVGRIQHIVYNMKKEAALKQQAEEQSQGPAPSSGAAVPTRMCRSC